MLRKASQQRSSGYVTSDTKVLITGMAPEDASTTLELTLKKS